jgi:hypothetical protein
MEFIRQAVSVGNLLLDVSNYRIVKQESQKAARDAIIAEQGKKLVNLAEDIIEFGLNPFDLPMLILLCQISPLNQGGELRPCLL